ncbi:MAG: hypothetical protein HC895_07260 [Leptolyngbyaceae cyanobacterium SM1_3_5]|nr:hypothetical protein [Leptolyngbyaceae cyanobacterium SM1_3_5]
MKVKCKGDRTPIPISAITRQSIETSRPFVQLLMWIAALFLGLRSSGGDRAFRLEKDTPT